MIRHALSVKSKLRAVKSRLRGFTLIELLTTLAISAILAAAAIPSFQHMILSSQSKNSINQITKLIRLARNIAVTQVITSTLCPSNDGLECNANAKIGWEKGILLFTDENDNRQIDGPDKIIHFQKPFLEQGSLVWKSLRNYIQFSSRGFPRGTVGSFIYCPQNKDNTYARSVSLSFQGKLRQGRDVNNDGIIEGGNHKNIDCT